MNQSGITSTAVDDDGRTGLDKIPMQYRKAISASREEGIPCLVVEGGGLVKTYKEITEELVLSLLK